MPKKPPEGVEATLGEILRAEYNRLDEQKAEEVSPAELANHTYYVIDPRHLAPDLVMGAALVALRQMARGICRARNKEAQELVEGSLENGNQETLETLFDLELQPRYPANRHEDEVYVLRERLTYEERLIVIAKLRAEASAKSAHADALEAETEKLIRSGRLHRQR